MQIADMTKMEVDTDFAEADATKLKVGMPASVAWNALTGATATGKVASIDPTATTSNNVVRYGVVVEFTRRPEGHPDRPEHDGRRHDRRRPQRPAVLASAVTTTGVVSTVLAVGSSIPPFVQVGGVGDTYTEITSGVTVGRR